MTLPTYLLPPGALSGMRAIARDFMTEPIGIYQLTLSYDGYGRQIVSSGLLQTVSGYVGAVRGTDRELLNATLQAYNQRQGVRTKTDALVLLPFGVELDESYGLRIQNQSWHVVWHNGPTQDSVQVYTKAIVVQYITQDEENYG